MVIVICIFGNFINIWASGYCGGIGSSLVMDNKNHELSLAILGQHIYSQVFTSASVSLFQSAKRRAGHCQSTVFASSLTCKTSTAQKELSQAFFKAFPGPAVEVNNQAPKIQKTRWNWTNNPPPWHWCNKKQLHFWWKGTSMYIEIWNFKWQ